MYIGRFQQAKQRRARKSEMTMFTSSINRVSACVPAGVVYAVEAITSVAGAQ